MSLSLHVTNVADHSLELDFPNGQTHDFVVFDSAGREVWRWSTGRMFTQALQNKLLSSSETVTISITAANIGLNPQNDGKILRLPIPELTEERRRDLIRMARSMAEEGRVSVRNVRRDEMRDLHELRKEGEISQDDEHRAEDELQKLTDDYVKRVEAALADKEAELSEV